MESTTKPPLKKTHKLPATVQKKPAPSKPLTTKPLQGFGYDDSTWFKIELTGSPLSADGSPTTHHLPTARRNLLVKLRWNRVKTTDAVTKADVDLEQVGVGYDTLSFPGGEKLDAEHGGKTVHWFQHTILFELNFITKASPIVIDLGQALKFKEMEKIDSTFAGTIKGWYDIATGASHVEVYFL
ncbi:MAG: hypothetical protein EOO62_23955 [Hymenobacter sp.]|nr:MAG: hypothetical protein EOO62_23955 [Hymenobacter sp.]